MIGRTLEFIAQHPLTADRPLAGLLRVLGWQISSRLRREHVFTWIAGSKLIVRRGMTGATGNIYCGLHEFEDMGFALHALGPGDLFLDVGANVGSYTVLAAAVRRARVIAFEPDPSAAEALWRNVAVNGVEQLVTLHEAVVGEAAGEVCFTVGLDTTNHVAAGEGEGRRRVAQVALDDVVGARAVTMIKLDVEGYEIQALAGAQATLAGGNLIAILSECHDPPVVELLGRHGFRRAFYDPRSRKLTDYPPPGSRGNLYVRDRAAVQERIQQAPTLNILGHSI